MSRTTSMLRKTGSILGKIILILIGILVVLLLLIQLPPVQNQLTGLGERFLQKKTGAEITIGKVYINFLGRLVVREVYVPDPSPDTLLYLGRLEVGFRPWGFLNRKVVLKKLELEDVLVDAHPMANGSMNYQYLIDAFAKAPAEEPPPKPKPGKPWDIVLPNASIGLHRIDLRYDTPDSSMVANGHIGQLDLNTDRVSIQEGKIKLDRLTLEDSDLFLGLRDSGEPDEEDASGGSASYEIESGEIAMRRVGYRMDMDDLLLDTYVGEVLAREPELQLLGDTLRIAMDQFDLTDGRYKMDIPSAEPIRGFDYSHMDLTGVVIRLGPATYDNLDIRGQVRELAARDQCGLTLTGFQAQAHYNPDSVSVRDLLATTPDSRIDMPLGRITTPFLEDSTRLEDMVIDLLLENTELTMGDVAYFVPALYDVDAYPMEKDEPWELNARLQGTLGDLNIADFSLAGRKAQAHLSGRVLHAMDMDRLVADLTIHRLQSSGPFLEEWLPPGTLPESVELPELLALSGRVNGPVDDLKVDLEASISRYVQPVTAGLRLKGELWNVLDTDRLRFDMELDTFWASRTEMQAYLPDSLLAQIRLPERAALHGRFRGTLDTAFADLELDLLRNGRLSQIGIQGRVDSLTNTDALGFDLELTQMVIQPDELLAYLPEDALPEYIRVPLIRSGSGAFRGNMQNLNGQIDLTTAAGYIHADAHLKDSAYVAELDIDSLVLQRLFTDSIAYDSVIPWPAPPIALHLAADGQGLDIQRDLLADMQLQLRFQGDTIQWDQGLIAEGKVDRLSFDGMLILHEREADLDLQIMADFNHGRDTTKLEGKIGKLDLFRLGLLKVPFDLQTRLMAQTKGRDPDSIYAMASVADFRIRYDSTTEYSKVITAGVERIKARNLFNAVLISDFVYATFVNQADYPDMVNAVIPQLAEKLEIPEAKLQLNEDSTQNLALNLFVNRPQIFTSGLIPGLTELDTIRVLGALDQQDSSFALYSYIPHIKYRAYEIDSTRIGAVNWDEFLLGALELKHARLFDRIDVRDLEAAGFQVLPGQATLLIKQVDTTHAPIPNDSIRFNITGQLTYGDGPYKIHFNEKPVFNYDKQWRFDPENEIVLDKKKLHVRNLKLSKGEQSLSIDEVTDDQIEVDFSRFDMAFFSDIIKWKADYLMGTANGQVFLTDPLDKPQLKTDLRIDEFGLLSSRLGDLSLQASTDESGAVEGDIGLNGEGNQVAIKGAYRPGSESPIQAAVKTSPLNLATLAPMLAGTVDALQGRLHTNLAVSGSTDLPRLTGSMRMDQVRVTPTLTRSPLSIEQGTVQFAENMISSPQEIVIRDSLGHEAKLGIGIVLTKGGNYVFASQMDGDDFLLLNTTAEDNTEYYGTVFADFKILVLGSVNDVIKVNCKMSPEKNSSFTYVLDEGDELEELETGGKQVEFVDFELLDSGFAQEEGDTVYRKERGIDLNITADMTKNLALTVITNLRTNDRLEGQGEGSLVLNYSPRGELELAGQLDVTGSKYFYTFQDVIKKDFELQEGSTITFTGPVDNPELDLKAGYEAKTAPYLLVNVYGDPGSEGNTLDRLKRRQDFLVTIQATGSLEEAELNADIEYPRVIGNNSADLVDPALNKLRGNPSEMNTQAFSLILFNSFRLSGGDGGGIESMVNLKQGLGNILSSQLNNLANRYINFVDLNFDIESLSDAGTQVDFKATDFRVGVKKSFLDDRLTVEVDGVASTGQLRADEYGNEYLEENMTAFLENVSVEYSITPKGNLRIRVFNQYDYDDFIGSNVIKLGATLIVTKDFNRLIFKKKRSQPQLPPPKAVPPPADSSALPGEEPLEQDR